jgi:hypothetical protein
MDQKTGSMDHSENDHGEELEELQNIGSCPHLGRGLGW